MDVYKIFYSYILLYIIILLASIVQHKRQLYLCITIHVTNAFYMKKRRIRFNTRLHLVKRYFQLQNRKSNSTSSFDINNVGRIATGV